MAPETSAMLALLSPSVAQCPVGSQAGAAGARKGDEVLSLFSAAHDGSTAVLFGNDAAIRYSSSAGEGTSQFAALDGVFCLFSGSLHNLSQLRVTYGLPKHHCSDAQLVIEAYRAIRDRAPFPMSQALAEFRGSFSFVLYDLCNKAALVAVDAEARNRLFWGNCADGTVALSDDISILRDGCGTSFAPFPAGCFFCSASGLKSFVHPGMGLKAVPHIDDSTGAVCGSCFEVDPMARVEARAQHVGSHQDLTAFTM